MESEKKIGHIIENWNSRDEHYNFFEEFENLVILIAHDSDIKKPSTLIRGEQLAALIQLTYELACGIENKYNEDRRGLEKYRDAYRKLRKNEKKKEQ